MDRLNPISYKELNQDEKNVFDLYHKINKLYKLPAYPVYVVNNNPSWDGLTLYTGSKIEIYIVRRCLKSIPKFLGVYLHEMTHVIWDHNDRTIRFENDLTTMLGIVAWNHLSDQHLLPKTKDQLFTEFCHEYDIQVRTVRAKTKNKRDILFDEFCLELNNMKL